MWITQTSGHGEITISAKGESTRDVPFPPWNTSAVQELPPWSTIDIK